MSAIVKYSFTSLFPHTVVPHKQLLCFPIQETQIDILLYRIFKIETSHFFPLVALHYIPTRVNVCAKFLQLCPILVSHHWSELPCLPSGDLPEPGSNPSFTSPASAVRVFTTCATWEAPYLPLLSLLPVGRSRHMTTRFINRFEGQR